MKIYKSAISGAVGTALSLVGVGVSADTLDHIVSIVCAIVGLIITIVMCLVIPLIKWYKVSMKDGKIDVEELDDLSHIIEDGKNEIDKHNQDK